MKERDALSLYDLNVPDIIFEIADKIGQLIQYRGRDDDLAHYCL